jgi:hypothetical protein
MFGLTKIKSYEQVTEQMQKIYYTELAIKHLLEQEYQELSWDEWAYCVVELEHMPVCIAVSEAGYTVLRDGLTARVQTMMLSGWEN